jgi:hypothetical protein
MVDVRRLPVGEDIESWVTLDELAREGARRMIATALRPRSRSTSSGSPTRSARTGSGWSCATAGRVSAG